MSYIKSTTAPDRCKRLGKLILVAAIHASTGLPRVTGVLIAASAVCVGTIQAQEQQGTGIVTGRVLNQATGRYLGGAIVSVSGTKLETLTGPDGSFRLSNVPAGETSVTATYTDLDRMTQTVTVTPGQESQLEFGLTAKAYEEIVVMSAYVVSGEREGSARAVHEQRTAASQKAIFAADSFGNVVDSNIGELMKNLPGITIDYNGEDASTMRVRGMEPELANITVDGNPAASIGNTESRAFNLQTQSLQNIETIEMDIAPTADKPANTMGGSINLVSKSALSQKGRRMRFTANLSLNTSELDFDSTPGGGRTPDRKIMPGFSFSYSEAFGRKRPLGVAFNTSFNRNYRFNNRYTVPRYSYDSGELADNGNKVSPDMTGVVPELQWSESGKSTQTRMISLNLDWKLTDDTTLFLYSSYNDVIGLGAYSRTMRIAAGSHQADSNFYNMVTHAGSSVNMNYGVSAEDSRNISFNGGARHTFGSLKLDYSAYYNRGESDPDPEKNFSVGYSYAGLGLTVNGLAGNATGTIEQTANGGAEIVGPDDPRSYRDIRNYNSLTMSQDFNYGVDQRRGAKIDATLPVELPLPGGHSMPVEVKAGASYGEQERESHRYWRQKRLTGSSSLQSFRTASEPVLYQFSDPYFRNTWSFDVPVADWLSPYAVRDYYLVHPDQFYDDRNDSTGQIYRELYGEKQTKEAASAGYGSITARPFRNLTAVLGLRYEHTKLTAEGPLYDAPYDDGKFFGVGQKYDVTSPYLHMPDNVLTDTPNPFYGMNWATQKAEMIPMLFSRRKGEKSYGYFFPNVQLKYEPFKNFNIRLARTENIGRPDFGNIMPNEEWRKNYHLIRRTNPDLQPQMSDKYDLALEYYFQGGGMATLALFHQDMKNVIATETSYITNVHDPMLVGPGVVYEPDYEEGQWSVETPVNTGEGRNRGFEFTYRQRLGFIARWLEDFQIFSSYSYADPKTWYMRRTISPPRAPAVEEDLLAYINSPRVREEIPMPGIQKRSASLQLHYLGKRVSGKIAAFWVDRFARSINREIVEINWQDAYVRYDLSLNCKLTPRWTATFDWRNITNEGDSRHIFDRTGGYFTSGMVINVGLRADL